MASKRFDNAISALVKAFFDGTLGKGNCCACAVGNICAAAINEKPSLKFGYIGNSMKWRFVFVTFSSEGQREFPSGNYKYQEGIDLINKTGYSKVELMKVELAFELNTKIDWKKYPLADKSEIMQDQYNGLMSVVDVLCEIEGIESAEYKKMFEYSV